MKKYLILLLLLIPALFLFSETVIIKSLPKTVEDFIALRDEISKTPEGGASIMIVALILYSHDEKLGRQCLTIAVAQERVIEGDVYKGFKVNKSDMRLIENQIEKQKYLAKSYISGTDPDKDYEIADKDLKLEFSKNKYTGDIKNGFIKLFVKSSGADTARPITVKVNDGGIWKALEWSSLVVGIRKAKFEIKKDTL
jgi:hypothetical protein